MRRQVDLPKLRERAASRGFRLVKGQGRVAGKQDYGKYGLVDARTGRKVMGFGGRGVNAWPDEVESFLEGADAGQWDATLKASKKRKGRGLPRPSALPL